MDPIRFQQLRDQALDSLVKGSSTAAEYQQVLQQIAAAEAAARAAEAEYEARYRRRANPDDGLASVPTMIRPAEPPPPMQPAKDMLISKYRLEASLRGGMGVVWKAWDTKGERWVALKFLPPELQGNDDEIARIRATFKLVEQLDHAHICRVFDLDEHPDFGWFQVMRWIEGQTLSNYRRDADDQVRCLSVAEVAELLEPVAEALDYAHSRKVLHRDIKPQNLMRDEHGHVSVVDFGLAAEVRSSLTRLSKSAVDLAGTQPYLAPELWEGGYATPKTDQYALGLMAYELLAGRYPFNADNPLILMQAVLNKPIPAIDGLGDQATATLQKCLARNPVDRFENCRDFAAAMTGTVTAKSQVDVIRSPTVGTYYWAPEPGVSPFVQVGSKVKPDTVVCIIETMKVFNQISAGMSGTITEALNKNGDSVGLGQPLFHVQVDDPPRGKVQLVAPQRPTESSQTKTNAFETSDVIEARNALLNLFEGDSQRELLKAMGSFEDAIQNDDGIASKQTATVTGSVKTGLIKQGSQAGERVSFNLSGIEYAFRWCPAGRFKRHDAVYVVLTSGFWMQETTVTQAMWQAVMDTQPWKRQQRVKEGPKYPVTYVDWNDATEFCQKLTTAARTAGVLPSNGQIVLPTEKCWEYACRAGTKTEFSFGDDPRMLGEYAWFDGNASSKGERYAHEVGLKKPNPWGLLDVHGNVCEWCQDEKYFINWKRHFVLRGGTWANPPSSASCSSNFIYAAASREPSFGFRVVVEL